MKAPRKHLKVVMEILAPLIEAGTVKAIVVDTMGYDLIASEVPHDWKYNHQRMQKDGQSRQMLLAENILLIERRY